MMRSLTFTLAGLVLLACSGCNKGKSARPMEGKMVKTSEDVLSCEEAMTASDVRLLLRGMTERQVIEQVKSRGLVDAIKDGAGLVLEGTKASPELLQVLANYDYVLSKSEQQKYMARQERRNGLNVRFPKPELSERDRENIRLQQLQDQEMANAQREREEQARPKSRCPRCL